MISYNLAGGYWSNAVGFDMEIGNCLPVFLQMLDFNNYFFNTGLFFKGRVCFSGQGLGFFGLPAAVICHSRSFGVKKRRGLNAEGQVFQGQDWFFRTRSGFSGTGLVLPD